MENVHNQLLNEEKLFVFIAAHKLHIPAFPARVKREALSDAQEKSRKVNLRLLLTRKLLFLAQILVKKSLHHFLFKMVD